MPHPSRLRALAGGLTGLLLVTTACSDRRPATEASTTSTSAATTAADSTTSQSRAMPTATSFGTTKDGTAVQLYTLQNTHGVKATITTYGGTLTSLLVPDKNGKLGDVVLGVDNAAGYTSDLYVKENPFFGALIGRYGNRISKGKFTLAGKTYSLPINNAPNSLHGGTRGFDKRLWTAIAAATGARGNTTALVGTPEQVAESLMDYYDLGVSTFLIRGFDPLEDAIQYGQELLPLVRAEVGRRKKEEQ